MFFKLTPHVQRSSIYLKKTKKRIQETAAFSYITPTPFVVSHRFFFSLAFLFATWFVAFALTPLVLLINAPEKALMSFRDLSQVDRAEPLLLLARHWFSGPLSMPRLLRASFFSLQLRSVSVLLSFGIVLYSRSSLNIPPSRTFPRVLRETRVSYHVVQ